MYLLELSNRRSTGALELITEFTLTGRSSSIHLLSRLVQYCTANCVGKILRSRCAYGARVVGCAGTCDCLYHRVSAPCPRENSSARCTGLFYDSVHIPHLLIRRYSHVLEIFDEPKLLPILSVEICGPISYRARAILERICGLACCLRYVVLSADSYHSSDLVQLGHEVGTCEHIIHHSH